MLLLVALLPLMVELMLLLLVLLLSITRAAEGGVVAAAGLAVGAVSFDTATAADVDFVDSVTTDDPASAVEGIPTDNGDVTGGVIGVDVTVTSSLLVVLSPSK